MITTPMAISHDMKAKTTPIGPYFLLSDVIMLEKMIEKTTSVPIQKIAVEVAKIKVREYRLESITGGSDALAEVSVKVEDNFGNVVSARKSGADVVVASVQAMMDAINKVMLRKVLES